MKAGHQKESVDETVSGLLADRNFAERTARKVVERASGVREKQRRNRRFFLAVAAAILVTITVGLVLRGNAVGKEYHGLVSTTAAELSASDTAESYWSETDEIIQTALLDAER